MQKSKPNALSLQTKIALREVAPTARAVNHREEVISAHWSKLFESSAEIAKEALLQGADLLRVKYLLGTQNFETWIGRECPLLPLWRARNYIKEASRYTEANKDQMELFDEAKALQGLARLCAKPEAEQHANEAPRQWPVDWKGLWLAAKVTGFIAKHPLNEWPAEAKDKLRSDLEPLAKELWPSRFV